MESADASVEIGLDQQFASHEARQSLGRIVDVGVTGPPAFAHQIVQLAFDLCHLLAQRCVLDESEFAIDDLASIAGDAASYSGSIVLPAVLGEGQHSTRHRTSSPPFDERARRLEVFATNGTDLANVWLQ